MIGFKSILGNEQIKEHFQKAIAGRKPSHAYILTGEKGMGKKTLAKAFAMTLLCQESGEEPCYECSSCRQFMTDNNPDVIYVSHEKPNSIGVDDIRKQINEDIMIKPYSSQYKIYIVDESEKMTVQAQNALLKTIEEPPAYGVLILLTTNADGLLQTILSRCVVLKMNPLHDKVLKDYLIRNTGAGEEQADVTAAFARGNLGKAIDLVSSEDFLKMRESTLHMLKCLKEMEISELLDYIREIKDYPMGIDAYLDFIQLWYRDILMLKVTNDINLLIFKDSYQTIVKVGQTSSFEGLESIIEGIGKAKARLKANVNFELAMELMLLTMKEN